MRSPRLSSELMADRYRERLPLHTRGRMTPLPARRTLAARARTSASNREIIDLVMPLAGWESLFEVTVAAEEVADGKPAPDVDPGRAVRRLARAGGSPCVAVEDSSAGIRSASAAGLGVVAIPNRSYRRARRRLPWPTPSGVDPARSIPSRPFAPEHCLPARSTPADTAATSIGKHVARRPRSLSPSASRAYRSRRWLRWAALRTPCSRRARRAPRGRVRSRACSRSSACSRDAPLPRARARRSRCPLPAI